MPHIRGFLLTVLAVLIVAGPGCRSTRGPVESSPSDRGSAEALDDDTLKTRARAHAHYAAGVIHDLNAEAEAANRDYEQAALDDSGDEALVLEVTRRLIQAKEFERALVIAQKSSARPDASGVIFARLGLIYAQLGRQQEAVVANQKAVSKAPLALVGYQNLFVGYVQAREEQKAWDVLVQAAGQSDVQVEYLVGLAELFNSFGLQFPTRRDEAKAATAKLLRRASELKPDNPALQLVLAEQLNQIGESEEAAKIYSGLLKASGGVPGLSERIHAKLSEIYLRSNNQDKAVEQLEALLKGDPTNPQAHYFLGGIAMDRRKPEEAIEHFNRTLVLKPDFEQAYYDLANAQISVNKPGEALDTLEKARQKFPETFVREFLAGIAHIRQKAYKEALQRFTAAEVIAKATDPKRLNQFFYFQLGAAYERSGDIEQAERVFLKTLEIAPDFDSAQNYLGYMWAERGQNLDRAKELIEKALKAEPENEAYLDSMAWVLFKMGKPEEALPHIEKAVQNSKGDPDATLFDHLGDIQAALKDFEKARAAWKKALEVEPNEAIRKKLDEHQGSP